LCLLIVFITLLAAGCQFNDNDSPQRIDEIPELTVIIREQSYTIIHGGYYLERRGSVEQTDAASPNQIAEDFIPFPAKKTDEIKFSISGNPETTVYKWGKSEPIGTVEHDGQIISLDEEIGDVIYEIVAEWKNAEASYTFVVSVRGK